MKTRFLLLFILGTFTSQAQQAFDQNSIEIQFGYSQPLNYFEDDSFGANFGLNNIKLGYRYMLNQNFGLRTSYVFNRYIPKSAEPERATSRMHSFNVELVYNLGRGLNLFSSPAKKVALLGYVGTGYARHYNPRTDLTEQMCPVFIGLSPLLNINQNMALFFDVNSVMNIQQDYGYNGNYTDEVKEFNGIKTGFHVNFSIGFMVYLGRFDSHADFL